MKTEDEVYNEIICYINGTKHNRPCTLASIKKVLRTPKVIALIFSRPDIFNLEREFIHVPRENLTEDILVKFILSCPKYFVLLDETLQTLPVMIAFEFSKRRFEHISALNWGCWGEKVPYPNSVYQYQNSVLDICDKLDVKYNDEDILVDYLKYIEQVSRVILEYCGSFDKKLEKDEEYNPKYQEVDYAYSFFPKEELGNAKVINILIEPISIERMYRHSKHMQHIPLKIIKDMK